jgi:hypothetical protein
MMAVCRGSAELCSGDLTAVVLAIGLRWEITIKHLAGLGAGEASGEGGVEIPSLRNLTGDGTSLSLLSPCDHFTLQIRGDAG